MPRSKQNKQNKNAAKDKDGKHRKETKEERKLRLKEQEEAREVRLCGNEEGTSLSRQKGGNLAWVCNYKKSGGVFRYDATTIVFLPSVKLSTFSFK